MSDYENGTPETDMTHLDEILDKHDYALDAHSGGPEKFRVRAMDNFTNRCCITTSSISIFSRRFSTSQRLRRFGARRWPRASPSSVAFEATRKVK